MKLLITTLSIELLPLGSTSLAFLRTALNVQLSNFVSFIARFFTALEYCCCYFLRRFRCFLLFRFDLCRLRLRSDAMVLILNLIFINFVYGDGTTQYQFRAGLNGFVLISIILLNAFSVLSLWHFGTS